MSVTNTGDRQQTHSQLPQESGLTQGMFDRLLTCLHADNREAAGEIYQHLRDSLIRYFERRKCSIPDALADQTLDRVAFKAMTKSIPILSQKPGVYCLRVARFVHLEYVRKEVARKLATPTPIDLDPDNELRYGCLEHCLAALSDEDRDFFLAYEKADARGKRALAASTEKSRNAIALRAFRIRRQLEDRTRKCFALRLKIARK